MNILEKLFKKENDIIEDFVTLNGARISRNKLQEKINEAKHQKNMKIVEINQNTYRTKLYD